MGAVFYFYLYFMSLLSHECVALIKHMLSVLLDSNVYLATSRDGSILV